MTEGILVALAFAALSFALSGARTTAYLLYFLAFVPFVSLDMSGGLASAEGLSGANVLFKLCVRAVTTLGLLALTLRRPQALAQLVRWQSLPVVFFFVWALLGLQRAQDPAVSLFRLVELFSFFLAGVVLFVESARHHGPREVVRWHCLALLQLPLVTLYFLQVHPELAYYERADGIGRLGHKFINSNSLGFACVAVALWATNELKERRERVRSLFHERLLPVLALLLVLYVLLGVRSRTAMVTLALGQGLLWFPFTWKQAWRLPAFGLVLLAGALFAVTQADTILEWFLRGESTENLASGTGRTGLWSALVTQQLPRAPLLGAGYLMLSAEGTFLHDGVHWSNAHNTYVYALISTGVPGFLAILGAALGPWATTFRRLFTTGYGERPAWILLFTLQTVVLVASVTGFGICGHPNPAMLFHYALYTYLVMGRPSRVGAARTEPRPSRVAGTLVAVR